jgi:ribonucleoside-diphosphate reductase alpha chain
MSLTVTKIDGTREPFNADRINQAIARACAGLPDANAKTTQVASETHLTLYDGITTRELDQAAINAAAQNIKDDPDFDIIAKRLLLKTIYKQVLGDYGDDSELKKSQLKNLSTFINQAIDLQILAPELARSLTPDPSGEDLTSKKSQLKNFANFIKNGISSGILDPRLADKFDFVTLEATLDGSDQQSDNKLRKLHCDHFENFIKTGVKLKILDPRLVDKFDLPALSKVIDPSRDELMNYTGISTMSRRYLSKRQDQNLIETPQYSWMRIAMGLALNETNPTSVATDFYHKMSELKYIPGGSTNINSGTSTPRLSNCFLMDMEDSIEHIGKTVSDVMKLSKATGGIGLSVTKLRANGSSINTNNTFSSGPIPFLHIIDSTIRAISRAGKKMGALCFYMENWHINFDEFLDLKQNSGDEYRRTRTANTAVYISDEFMKRVAADDWWYLFDPKETADLIELYGAEFSKRYHHYITEAEAGNLQTFKKIKAKEQLRSIIVNLQATSHPWLTWKDAINVRALNSNTGTIHCSNLCTEITLPQNRDNVSVCNLTSINLTRHLDQNNQINWDELKQSTRLAIRQLDNLVDINQPPIPEALNFDSHNRAVGLGIMGLADTLERLGLAYESNECYELVDQIMEFISYHAIDESADLAVERGSYDNFPGSLWSQGLVPLDTIKRLEQDRSIELSVNQTSKLDWAALRLKVKKGMRNSTLMAIAPTANIGLVAGTSPGIDPRFAQMFSRNTLSGKYMEINTNLVADLKALGLWDKVKDQLLENYGSLEKIDIVPDKLKHIYKDSFSTAPQAFIEVAARAQKWVDQAISRNMYLETRDTDEVMGIYQQAWRSGLKTTYYLHMKPRHQAEQSTVKVNKSSSIGKVGFGAARLATPVSPVANVTANTTTTSNTELKKACPIDPMERLQCESCQ